MHAHVWTAASPTKFKILQTLRNKFLRIFLKAPKKYKNLNNNLNKFEGAPHYQIGKKTSNPKLKRHLPQDIFLKD